MRTEKTHLVRLATVFSVLAMTVGCDQSSKAAARAFLSEAHPVKVFGGILEFTLSQNGGAFLGLGSSLSASLRFLLFSVGGSLIMLVGLYFLIFRKQLSNRLVMALSILLGGALGNQIDRFVFHGSVTDFLLLSLGPVHTGIFNIADMAVMFGAALFLMASWRGPDPLCNPDPGASA